MPYNRKVMDHFMNPRNAGELKDADGEGKASNDVDGDTVVIRFKVRDGKIVEARHQVFGCAAAIAGSSAFTEMIIGRTVEEALKFSKQDVAEHLGGLPEGKIACSILGPEAFAKAVDDYRCRKS